MKYNQINDRLTISLLMRLLFSLFFYSEIIFLELATRSTVCKSNCARGSVCVWETEKSRGPDVESICSSDIYSTHRGEPRLSQSVGNLFGCELMMLGTLEYKRTHTHTHGMTEEEEQQLSSFVPVVVPFLCFCIIHPSENEMERYEMMMIRYSIRSGTIPRMHPSLTTLRMSPGNFFYFSFSSPPAAADETLGTDTVVIADDSIINQNF